MAGLSRCVSVGQLDPREAAAQSLQIAMINRVGCNATKTGAIFPEAPLPTSQPYGGVSPVIALYPPGLLGKLHPALQVVIPPSGYHRLSSPSASTPEHGATCRLSITLPSPPPTGEDQVEEVGLETQLCHHVSHWKRLRAKRGISYFVCFLCGIKWRVRANGDLVFPKEGEGNSVSVKNENPTRTAVSSPTSSPGEVSPSISMDIPREPAPVARSCKVEMENSFPRNSKVSTENFVTGNAFSNTTSVGEGVCGDLPFFTKRSGDIWACNHVSTLW